MSSHREAPQISKDPVADSTDVYAFRSPDKPSTVTLIANYIPLQLPDGGPTFYEFGDDVYYDVNVDNTGNGLPSITYRFEFTTTVRNDSIFLYNTAPILDISSTAWNRPQTYTLTRIDYDSTGVQTGTTTLGTDMPVPPCNVGPLSTPDYPKLGMQAIKTFSEGGYSGTVYAGQRSEGFYVDLGSIFDLGTLRPLQTLHTTFGLANTGLGKMAAAINATENLNVHSLILQVPISDLTVDGNTPTDRYAAESVIGVWTSASRPASRVYPATNANGNGEYTTAGDYVQVSRLGNPLVNEVLIGLADKDKWNTYTPSMDSTFMSYFTAPVLAGLLPDLYPGALPKLAKYNEGTVDRADIIAILLTGIPHLSAPKTPIIPNFQNELTAVVNGNPTYADMLRLNVAIPPAKTPNVYGVLGGDLAGFPNGRRVWDDVTTIELRALAGLTLPLTDPSYKADAAAALVTQGLTNTAGTHLTTLERYQKSFPYLGRPTGGSYVGEIPSPTPEMDTVTAPVTGTAPEAPADETVEVADDKATAKKRLLDMSRRGFLRTGSIGVLAAGVAGSVPGLSSLLSSAETDAPEVAPAASGTVAASAPAASADTSSVAQTVTAHVTNIETGEMKLFFGNQTVELQSPELAQKINQAARLGSAGR